MSKITLVSIALIGMLSSGFGWKESLPQSTETGLFEKIGYRVRGGKLLIENLKTDNLGIENNTANRGISGLKVRAYPEQAVTPLDGGQTIYVIVQDQQRLLPVQGAQVSLVIRMPSGEEDRIIFPTLTDSNGITQFAFSYTTSTIGIVEIKVTAVFEKLQATTSTCFWLWW